MIDFSGKKVLVVGLAKSGVSSCDLLIRHGAIVTVSDNKERDKVASTLEMINGKVGEIFGRNPSEEEALSFDCIVPSPAVPADLPWLNAAREKGIPVISEIELASFFCKAGIVGITGTNGKTTTTTLVGEILKAWKKGSIAAGNIGVAFTGVCEEVKEDAMVALELSSFQLETIDTFKPHISAILNFTPDHLNRHHTYENYIDAKCRIFENQDMDDFCILNYDDEKVREKGMELMLRDDAPLVVWFSHTVRTQGGVYSKDGFIMADEDGKEIPIIRIDDMQIFGSHNEENAMAAVALCLKAGVPAEIIREEMKRFPGVAHRIEAVGCVDGVNYYNDSKGTNPDAAIKGLLAMKSEKTVLIGGGYDKGTPYDDWCRLFPGRVRELVLIGATAKDIEACALKYGFPKENIYHAETFVEAVNECRKAAQEGDSVLLSPACASWGMFDNYEQRGDIFRQLVRDMK